MQRALVSVLAVSLAVSLALVTAACQTDEPVDSVQRAAGNGVRSQLRGYDLGPPFPAGFRDSGLINGYDEGEWIPFVAAIEGRKLESADANAGAAGDGVYRASIIAPTYSPRNLANGISDLAVTGTYGAGDITPIPSTFDDDWLVDNGYAPFVLGAFADGGADEAPDIVSIRQRKGPTRFGGDVSSVSVSVEFTAPAGSERVELRFAVRLAPPDLAPIGPPGQAFPGTQPGVSAGAAAFHPGPGPLFVGYEVGDPTGIATVPIKVEHNDCDSDDDCVPGEYCGAGGECEEPCASDPDCPTEEICEDGVCVPPPPACDEDADCNGDYCVGGFCVPECPDSCADPELCDPDPCVPPDGPPPCVLDSQCPGGDVCEDGVCVPPPPPCDLSCPEDDVCVDDYCEPPGDPCSLDTDCPGGSVCVDGVCSPGEPPCEGPACSPCDSDDDCPGGTACLEGVCIPIDPPTPCTDDADCPADRACEAGYCQPPPDPCGPTGECRLGELCEEGPDVCVPEHPPVPCTSVTDCPSGDECVGGFCEQPPTPCNNFHDCDPGDECVDKVCVPPGGGPCTDDGDCSGGYCVDGVCEPPHPTIPCTDESECPSGDECIGGFCVPPEGCERDETCPGGELCEDGTCRPGDPPEPCTVDEDCPPTDDDVFVPVCYGGFCTPGGGGCSEDSECDGGTACIDGNCLPIGDPTSCQTQFDCGGGAVCEGGFCVPTDSPAECTVAEDCPADPEDDVVACIGGLCTSSRLSTTLCSTDGDCNAGRACTAGTCGVIPGACELDGDCSDAGCIDGWCGTACATAGDCAAGEACTLGRCGASCATYAECGTFQACLGGGCLALPAYVAAGRSGDQSVWAVDVPGEGQSDVAGGCAAAPGERDSTTSFWLLVLIVPLGLARRRRLGKRAWVAPLFVLAVLATACGSGGADNVEGDDDTASAPDAGGWIYDAAPAADADYSSSPFLLVTCAADGDEGDYADAGSLDAGAGDAGPAEPPSGVDEPCCDPTGTCAGDLACIQGPTPDEHRCRPRCDLAVRECPAGGVCADFGGEGVCIPASTEGLDCAPELCDSATICVGSSADDATCHRRCDIDGDCEEGETCTQLLQTEARACL